MSVESFGSELNEFAAALNLNIDLVVVRLALELWDDITVATPVDTGRCRSNWNPGFGSPDLSVIGAEKNPKKGVSYDYASKNDNGRSAISGATGKEAIYITNSLVYAPVLENGHSGQAPQGMVRPAVDRARAQINAIVSALS